MPSAQLKLSTRVFQELRVLDVEELGKLANSLPPAKSDSAAAKSASSSSSAGGSVVSEAPTSSSDEYAVDTSSARVELPDTGKWCEVLAAMRLTPDQQDAYAEVPSPP